MAQQQHRQACLARWPGHHSKHTETRRRRRNSQECSQRSKVEDQDGDTTAQPQLRQQGHRPKAATARGATSCSWPSGRAQHGGDVGVAAAIQPTWRRGGHRKHCGARARAPARLAGVDQAARARSTGAELDGDWRQRRQNPAVRRKRATRRSGYAIGRRRISPELAGVGRGARRRLGIARGGIRVKTDREGRE
jgi:hypothetical protein